MTHDTLPWVAKPTSLPPPVAVPDWEHRLRDATEYWRRFIVNHARDFGRVPHATIDFETRCEESVTSLGAYKYSMHPTCEVMVLRYRLPRGDEVGMWHRAHPQHLIAESDPPLDLFAFILAGGHVEAHNAGFERNVWRNVMHRRHGWPAVPNSSWRCSAARAAALSLPRRLEDACLALDVAVKKDMEGNRAMKRLAKPRKPRKDERTLLKQHGLRADEVLFWNEAEEDIVRNWDYCGTDVLAEESLSEAIPPLSDFELRVWQMDQEMNDAGARFDLEMAEAALDLAAAHKEKLNARLEKLTGIRSATQRAKVKDWLNVVGGVEIDSTAAEVLDWALNPESGMAVEGPAIEVMAITKAVNRTSTRKYTTMLKTADDRGYIRDLLMYHGANTGRWTGKGVQVHNLPKGLDLKALFPKSEGKTYMETTVADIKDRDAEWVAAMYGDPMDVISWAIRGAIIPSDGHDLMMADYAAIEARCVLWEADARDALEVFRRGGDIYCDMATGIYGYEVHKDTHPVERQFGKQAILGLGYGMGWVKFLITCRKYDIVFSHEDVLRIMGADKMGKYVHWVKDKLLLNKVVDKDKIRAQDKREARRLRHTLREARLDPERVAHELALMKYVVDVYRARYSEVKQMWKDQEAAAIEAVRDWQGKRDAAAKAESDRISDEEVEFSAYPWELPSWGSRFDGKTVECGKVRWYVRGRFLHCELPSGRRLSYVDPVVKEKKTSWGELRPHLSYMSVDSLTKKWVRTGTYGGKIVENITQAVARDVLTEALMRIWESDLRSTYRPVLHVHDELVCEVPHDEGSTDEFEELMSAVPPWAIGCPIAAEAERCQRYRK